MHAAKLDKSQRLKRVLNVLKDARERNEALSTMQIIRQANVCAVNSIIAELRANGYPIDCTRDSGVWRYTLQVRHE